MVLHYASGTLKAYTPEQRAKFNKGFAGSKAYYARKWGGPANDETFRTPFGAAEFSYREVDPKCGADFPVTTPDLQRHWQINRRPTDPSEAPSC